MATLNCSQGHPNPLGQHFCGTCGEDLTADHEVVEDSSDDPVERAARPAVDNPVSRRMGWVLFALAAVFLSVAVVGFLVARRQTSSPGTGPGPASTVTRQQKVVWYFPQTTAETDLVNRVDQFCAANPSVATVEINLMDLDEGNMTSVVTTDYPCT